MDQTNKSAEDRETLLNANKINDQSTFEIEKYALDGIREYASIAFTGIISSLILIASLLYFSLNLTFAAYWILCIFITQIVSFYCRRKLPRSKYTHKQKLNFAILLNIFDGCVIASLIIFMPYIDDIIRTVLIFAMVTSCIGATITTLGYRPFYLAFTIPITLSIISSSLLSIFLWDGAEALYIVFIISCSICCFIYISSRGIYDNLKKSFISNLKSIEINNQLNAAINEVKRANRSKTKFFASASHDLRQPINTISLFLATLSLEKRSEGDTQIFNHMSTSIKTIDTQLTSLIEISKLDSDVIEPDNSNINIVPILEEITHIFRDQNQTNPIVINFTADHNNISFFTDQTLFERVINNLIDNSIKYTNEGTINVNVKKIDSTHASISITDTGIGISEEHLEDVYNEFYQVDSKSEQSESGFGLGLSIVKRLCDLLELKINITSELGSGTEVSLTFACQYHE